MPKKSGFIRAPYFGAGFTLVELLIVLSIISVLLVIGLVLYTKILQNARDSKRQADLSFIQSALEAYYSDQFYYPVKSTAAGCPSNGQFAIVTGSDCPFKNPLGNKTYMISIPRDPILSPTNQYRYEALPASCNNTIIPCTSYCLYADLENKTITNSCADISGYDMKVTAP